MEPILTIAIPTFNHHNLLKKQIINLLPQLTSNINLYILDNCSNPPMRVFLENEGINTSQFTIIENNQNIGGDANILKCYSIVKTGWIWVLSDDDLIQKDALTKLMKIISENSDTVFINLHALKNKQGLTKGYNEFCKNACYWATFSISHCIFNMDKFANYLPYYEKQVKTHQPQLLTLLKYLKENNDDICFFSNVNIFNKLDPTTWPKAGFIYDTLSIYKSIPQEDLSFFKLTIGRQVIKTQIAFLVIARIYEGLSFKNYIYLFKLVINNSPKSHLIFNKSVISWILCLISPKAYYFFRKIWIPKSQDYPFSDASKSLNWND